MNKNKFGEIVLDQDDLCSAIMQGLDVAQLCHATVDSTVDLQNLIDSVNDSDTLRSWHHPQNLDLTVEEYDQQKQSTWFMPSEYHDIDIAQHVLQLCQTPEQLQRAGEELLLYQQHNLFDLLRYLRYLVDVMRCNHIIWGVGRGSSVASYVLYLLGVHRVDSLYYDLDPREFLR